MLDTQTGRERRRKGRVRCENVMCNLGAVIDISASGIRVHRSGMRMFRPGKLLKIRLMSSDAVLDLRGRVAWCRSVGFCQQVFGVHFEGLTREQESMLITIGRHNRRLHAA